MRHTFSVIVLFGLLGAGCGSSGHSLPRVIACEGLELVLVPQGNRMIGTDNSRAHPRQDWPQTWFKLDYILYMGTTEVTAEQYRRILGDPGLLPSYEPSQPVYEKYSRAVRFCAEFAKKLESATGRRWEVRLPNEAEWEYAACWGRPPTEDWWPVADVHSDYDLMAHEWFCENSGGKTHPVRQKKATSLGLYDMLANAPEWCHGWFVPNESVATMLARLKQTGFVGEMRPWRGGSASSSADECRPSRRAGWYPESAAYAGFRIVALPK